MQTVLPGVPIHTSQMALETRPLEGQLVEESRLMSLLPLRLTNSSPRLTEALPCLRAGLPHQLNVG